MQTHRNVAVSPPIAISRSMSAALCRYDRKLPPREAILATPGAHLHAYGKEAAPGRKVGHVTVRADDDKTLRDLVAKLLPLVDPTT